MLKKYHFMPSKQKNMKIFYPLNALRVRELDIQNDRRSLKKMHLLGAIS